MAKKNIDEFQEILNRLDDEVKALNKISFKAQVIVINITQKIVISLDQEIENLSKLMFETQGIILALKFLLRKMKNNIENQ